MTPTEYITTHDPCDEAADYLRSFPTVAEAWDACTRPDWLIWAARRLGAKRPADATFRRIACRLVRETPLHDGRKVWDLLTDERSRRAVEVAEAHSRGEATDEELAAAAAAADAADAATAAFVAAAADAATYVASAAFVAYTTSAREKARAVRCSIIRAEIANPFRA